MIAAAFAYSNYRYSEYKFIDFSQWTFYTKKDIFTPTRDNYTVVVYSSKMQDFNKIKDKINTQNYIIALDMFQKRATKGDKVLHVSAGMNTLLKVIQRFNIYELPSSFDIARFKKTNYKQDSLVKIIK